MTRALDDDRLRLQPNPEAFVYAGLYGACQRDDLAPPRSTPIHKHQRLLLIHAGIAHRLALPAARIDQPARGQLHRAVGHRVVHDVRFARDDVLALLGRDGGVLEEAAGVADDARVGELARPDGANPVVDL